MLSSTKKQKRNQKRKNNKETKRIKTELFMMIFKYIRIVIDTIIDFIFGLYYGDGKSVRLPNISEPFLSESAVKIAGYIRERKLTCEEVVKAYIARVNQVNGIINAVVDNRFENAVEEAKRIDRNLSENKYTEDDFKKKPFLGVPFSTKESTSCAGMLWTFGLVCRKDVKATEDADIVRRMKEAGGILIVNTNIPEFNLWQETRNYVFGQTNNPYNVTRTTGGSSGGEASLIASCGTAMGLGTDIGGSIRMPAFFCGIYGHKPSSYLISTKGLTRRNGTEKHTIVVAGPMARHAEDLTPMLKVLIEPQNLNKLKLDQHVDVTKLKFFYMDESNDSRVSAMSTEMIHTMSKVVNHMNEVLSEDVTKLKIDEFRWSSRMWRYWMTQENLNFKYEIADRKGEVNVFKEILKKFIGMSNYTWAAIFKLCDDLLPRENEQWAREKTNILKEKLLNELGENGVLLYPSYTWPASYHGTAFFRPYNFSYWCVFNAVQFPVTQIPLGLSKDGLPVGIQIVAAPYNDHLCLAVARYLEEIFGGYVPPFQ